MITSVAEVVRLQSELSRVRLPQELISGPFLRTSPVITSVAEVVRLQSELSRVRLPQELISGPFLTSSDSADGVGRRPAFRTG